MAYIDVAVLSNGSKQVTREEIAPGDIWTSSEGRRFMPRQAIHLGSNGVVFAADELSAAGAKIQGVALKVLRQLSPSSRDRFANESRILSGLNHQSISGLYGVGSYAAAKTGLDVPWIATDRCGVNLRQHVMQSGVLPPSQLKNVAFQLCDALQHVHEAEIIHRDLKPANMVWASTAESGRVKLIDFGIAKRLGEDVSGRPLDDFTRAAEFVGPVFYSSPELVAYADNKQTPVDHRSDLFQLGKVMWYLATGRILTGIPSLKHDPTNGPLLDLVSRLIADDPTERPDSAAVVRAEIENWPTTRASAR